MACFTELGPTCWHWKAQLRNVSGVLNYRFLVTLKTGFKDLGNN